MNELLEVWGRFGMTLQATEEELDALLLDPYGKGVDTIARIFAEGRAKIDGECYIPGECVEEVNRKHGVFYVYGDVDLDTSQLQDKTVQVDPSGREWNKSFSSKNRGDAR